MKRPKTSELERFLHYAGTRPSNPEDCWLWQAGHFNNGYGAFVADSGTEGAHRTSYRLSKGAIPKGNHVRHKCDVRGCVNPDHLEVGINADNMRDRDSRGRGCYAGDPRHPQTILNPEKVRSIRREYSEGGVSYSQLAEKYGCDMTNIYRVVKRKTWKNVRGVPVGCVRKRRLPV